MASSISFSKLALYSCSISYLDFEFPILAFWSCSLMMSIFSALTRRLSVSLWLPPGSLRSCVTYTPMNFPWRISTSTYSPACWCRGSPWSCSEQLLGYLRLGRIQRGLRLGRSVPCHHLAFRVRRRRRSIYLPKP